MRSLVLLVLAVLIGCVSRPEPVRYVVVRGDTLGEIATAHGVTVDQLRAWNGIEGDLIEVDQVLVIHTDQPAPEPTAAPAPRPRARGTTAGTAEPAPDALVMPAAKPCLGGPTADGLAEQDMTASQGLSRDQVKQAFGAFAPRTTACLPSDWTGSASPQFDLVIGCDGLVREVSVSAPSGLSDEVLGCLTDRLRYAEFPAHDLPDGERARVPLHLSAQ